MCIDLYRVYLAEQYCYMPLTSIFNCLFGMETVFVYEAKQAIVTGFIQTIQRKEFYSVEKHHIIMFTLI